MHKRKVLFAAPRDSAADFAALLEAYRERGIAVAWEKYGSAFPDVRRSAAQERDLDAVLLAGPARLAPGRALPGPFVANGAGRPIPAAWFPIRNRESNLRFARAASKVQLRPRQEVSVALMAQWSPRYLKIADRIQALLGPPVRLLRWTEEVIGRDGLVAALGSGVALGVYVGHGRPVGWAGYHGMRSRHLEAFAGEPLGAMISLCCRTASRWRTGLSYAEALPACGVAAAAFGATCPTRHTDNTRWAVRLCDRLAAGADSVGALVVASAPLGAGAVAPYRLVGDPLAPLAATAAGGERARAVRTYP